MKNIKTYEEFDDFVLFKDFLKKFLNRTISKDITLFEISELSCDYEKLIDLDGIEQFVDLKQLWCYNNKISSLEPLKNLTKLYYLSCNDNKISSLNPLKNLSNLLFLACSKNEITSLEGIENLTKLEVLNCNYNKITSLKGIENLNKLENLYCKYNPIDWIDYIDKKGNTWYIELPKSIIALKSDKFKTIGEYWKFMDENQPASVSKKFNF